MIIYARDNAYTYIERKKKEGDKCERRMRKGGGCDTYLNYLPLINYQS